MTAASMTLWVIGMATLVLCTIGNVLAEDWGNAAVALAAAVLLLRCGVAE